MAASQKVERFDSEGLEDLKMSLICSHCKVPPRPNEELYSCPANDTGKCSFVLCKTCRTYVRKLCQHKKMPISDPFLKKFLCLIKVFNCRYFSNGCQMELEANDLKAHEEICLLRTVDCPKHGCDATNVVFDKLLDHFKEKHSDLEMKDDVLEFKGSLEDLEKSTFILNCYGKLFFPQFCVNQQPSKNSFGNLKMLHFWIVGHGNQDEINSFEVLVKFWINGRTILTKDFVIPIRVSKIGFRFGCNDENDMVIPVKKVTQYYDVQSKESKNQEFIEFEMKVTCPKLDEIAKDENVESGVEDSETEEK